MKITAFVQNLNQPSPGPGVAGPRQVRIASLPVKPGQLPDPQAVAFSMEVGNFPDVDARLLTSGKKLTITIQEADEEPAP